MSSEFQVDTDPATPELMENALGAVLERHGFQVVFHLGGTPGSRVTEYRKNDDLVSAHSEYRPGERRQLTVHSERVALEELAATSLLGELLQPLVSGGKVSVPSLNRRVRRLVQDARGGHLSP